MPVTIGHFNRILSDVRLVSYTLEQNKLHICNYCMTRRAIQGNILLEVDNIGPTKGGGTILKPETEYFSALADSRNCINGFIIRVSRR